MKHDQARKTGSPPGNEQHQAGKSSLRPRRFTPDRLNRELTVWPHHLSDLSGGRCVVRKAVAELSQRRLFGKRPDELSSLHE